MSATLNVQHAPIERLALDSAGWPGLWAWPVGNRVGESPVWDAAEQAMRVSTYAPLWCCA